MKLSFHRVLALFAAAALAAAIHPASASATTYSETFAFDPADVTCGAFSGVELCAEAITFATPFTAVVGDKYNIHVTMTGPLVIPGSTTQDVFVVSLLDSAATKLSPGGPGPYISKSKLIMNGYSGPPAPIGGGGTVAWDQGYFAVGGFCCGYGTPNAGFSLDGADASITLLTADPNQLVAMAVSYAVGVPEPATWGLMILGFGLAGGALRRRTRAALAALT